MADISTRIRRSTVAAAAFLFTVATAGAQTGATIQVRHAVTCASCRIEFTEVARFGSVRDSLSPTGTPVRDSRGRYFAKADGQLAVLMFDSSGALRRTFGRPGEGPGEFNRWISRIIVGRGDSIFVFHGGNRVEVFSPNLSFARRMTLPALDNGYTNTVAQIEGGFVFEAEIFTADRIGIRR